MRVSVWADEDVAPCVGSPHPTAAFAQNVFPQGLYKWIGEEAHSLVKSNVEVIRVKKGQLTTGKTWWLTKPERGTRV